MPKYKCKKCGQMVEIGNVFYKDGIICYPCYGKGGSKNDDEKLRYDLIPPEALRALATVLTFGAGKYKPRNWEEGIPSDRLFAARQRHEWAVRNGEYSDQESNLPHLWHAFCNLAMQITLEERVK